MGTDPGALAAGLAGTRRRRPRRRRVLLALLLLLLVALATAIGSYTSAMLRPSSLPLSIRSVEWLRANGGAWLVNDVESLWYRWHAPRKGGPTLTALPLLRAAGPARRPAAAAKRRLARHYVPPRIAAVIRPRLPGEGLWQRTGFPVRGGPAVLVAAYRPDPTYPRLVAYVAWIDHTRTRLALYPGRYEPPSAPVRGPMQVPYGERRRLLATFNSGFTYRDGHGGFVVDGRVYEPLRDGVGTVVAYRSGRVDITTWHGGPDGAAGVVLARQNLPLIVDGGRLNPRLDNGPEWGQTLGNAVRVWRSGIGIDRRGNLLYAAANDQTVRSLAQLLVHVGAVRAIELDINAEWPSFIGYGRRGGRDPLALVPNVQQRDTRYLVPDDRDFFAVYARTGGGAAVPFR